MSTIPHWIDGARTTGVSSRKSDVFNPATGEVAAQVVLAEQADVDLAVSSSLKAAQSWSESSLSTRSRILFDYRHLLHDAPRRAGRDHHVRARQGALRRGR